MAAIPNVVLCEYLELIDPALNKDKFYLVLVIEDSAGTFATECVYGRRGSLGMVQSKCQGARRGTAESTAQSIIETKRSDGYQVRTIPRALEEIARARADGRLGPAGTKPSRYEKAAPVPSPTPTRTPRAKTSPGNIPAPVGTKAATFAAHAADPGWVGLLAGDGAPIAVRIMPTGVAVDQNEIDTSARSTTAIAKGIDWLRPAAPDTTVSGDFTAAGRFRVVDCPRYRGTSLVSLPFEDRYPFVLQVIDELAEAGQLPSIWEAAKIVSPPDLAVAGLTLRDLGATYGLKGAWERREA